MDGILVADKYGSVQETFSTPEDFHAIADAFEGASGDYTDLEAWLVSNYLADEAILPNLHELTAKAKDLERNNGYASGFPKTLVDNVVGPNVSLVCKPNWRALGWTKEQARQWAQGTEAHFSAYAKSVMFDYHEKKPLSAYAGQVIRGRFSAGGSIVLPMWEPGRLGASASTCFKSVDINRLSNPHNAPDTNTTKGGITFDSQGREKTFHIATSLTNMLPGMYTPSMWTNINAKTPWGRRRVLHCVDTEQPGQTRGVPALAPVLRDFKSLDNYNNAELIAAVRTAQNIYFAETHLSSEVIASMFGGGVEDFLVKRKAINDAARSSMKKTTSANGMIIPITPGDKIITPEQSRPNSEFANFSRSILRSIATCLGVSVETFTRDFTNVNYSAARAALAMDFKTFSSWLSWLSDVFLTPVYVLWLEEKVNEGVIEAPDFYDNFAHYANCAWIGASRSVVDPPKEATAAKTRLHSGNSTQQIEWTQQGSDWYDMQEQRLVEIENASSLVADSTIPETLRDIAVRTIAGMPLSAPTAANSGEGGDEDEAGQPKEDQTEDTGT